eukprot:3822061-Amphidinium_carterae.1
MVLFFELFENVCCVLNGIGILSSLNNRDVIRHEMPIAPMIDFGCRCSGCDGLIASSMKRTQRGHFLQLVLVVQPVRSTSWTGSEGPP